MGSTELIWWLLRSLSQFSYIKDPLQGDRNSLTFTSPGFCGLRHPETSWSHSTEEFKQFRRFLECADDNFLFWERVNEKRCCAGLHGHNEWLVGDVKVKSSHGCKQAWDGDGIQGRGESGKQAYTTGEVEWWREHQTVLSGALWQDQRQRAKSETEEALFAVRVTKHWQRFPGRLWSLHTWRYSKATTLSWVTAFGCSCLSRVAEPDDALTYSFPFWYKEYLPHLQRLLVVPVWTNSLWIVLIHEWRKKCSGAECMHTPTTAFMCFVII